jgi:hypothetical protein
MDLTKLNQLEDIATRLVKHWNQSLYADPRSDEIMHELALQALNNIKGEQWGSRLAELVTELSTALDY